jgi:tetratricopeptide (TPR) repeat protein
MKYGNAVAIALALLALGSTKLAAQTDVRTVEPAELSRHPEWARGEQVEVEDRVQFLYHEPRGFDELSLKRAPNVVVKLPQQLQPRRGDEAHVVRLQGKLHSSAGIWTIDVTALTYMPRDIDRLEQAVKSLSIDDYKNRLAWARWAEYRAAEFNDEVLKLRARDLEAEATWIEADRAELGDRAALWLALANRSKGRLLEPEPSALAHRAFRARLAAARTAVDLDALAQEVIAFFPKAAKPAPPASLANVAADYAEEPGQAYRRASNALRAVLDRRLLTDVIAKSLELQAAERPAQALALADEAQSKLPDRPEVANKLRANGLEAAVRDVASLRSDDVESLAKTFVQMGQPERAQDLKRRWLDDTRINKLSSSDATGRVLLAGRYAELLDDRDTAKLLLLDALRIDPKYREAEDALRRLGFRKVDDAWLDDSQRAEATSARPEEIPIPPPSGEGGLLRGLTKGQVRAKLGVPNEVSRAAVQGMIVEQWIYKGVRGSQYINFIQRPTMPQATVEAYFSQP